MANGTILAAVCPFFAVAVAMVMGIALASGVQRTVHRALGLHVTATVLILAQIDQFTSAAISGITRVARALRACNPHDRRIARS